MFSGVDAYDIGVSGVRAAVATLRLTDDPTVLDESGVEYAIHKAGVREDELATPAAAL